MLLQHSEAHDPEIHHLHDRQKRSKTQMLLLKNSCLKEAVGLHFTYIHTEMCKPVRVFERQSATLGRSGFRDRLNAYVVKLRSSVGM